MLVLSRKLGEEIVIDNGRVVMTVVEIGRGKVRLGFTAARDVLIDRREIHERRNCGEIRGEVRK